MNSGIRIPFNIPFISAHANAALEDCLSRGILHGDGPYTAKVHNLFSQIFTDRQSLFVHSGTAALEMAIMLLEIGPGDEVIMPSFTFTSTANAVVLRGATPVFVDVSPDTMCIDISEVGTAINSATRAIIAVHYAGMSADMDLLTKISTENGIALIEDAAQSLGSSWNGKPLGTFGDIGCISFHATKNIGCGEGGAILLKENMLARAEMIREKGTDRSMFIRGETDKYTWRCVGSSYLPSDISASLLYSQLQHLNEVTSSRVSAWNKYKDHLSQVNPGNTLELPHVDDRCDHNGHIFHVICRNTLERDSLRSFLLSQGIESSSHYQPLHLSPQGQFCKMHGDLSRTSDLASRLLRLPLWHGIEEHIPYICSCIAEWMEAQSGSHSLDTP